MAARLYVAVPPGDPPDARYTARATLCAMKKLLLLIALVALATVATKKVRSV